tara:strand:+ start:725 stop:1189 length:465 start_codon:yes stop_codon:yes gene_type:complete
MKIYDKENGELNFVNIWDLPILWKLATFDLDMDSAPLFVGFVITVDSSEVFAIHEVRSANGVDWISEAEHHCTTFVNAMRHVLSQLDDEHAAKADDWISGTNGAFETEKKCGGMSHLTNFVGYIKLFTDMSSEIQWAHSNNPSPFNYDWTRTMP